MLLLPSRDILERNQILALIIIGNWAEKWGMNSLSYFIIPLLKAWEQNIVTYFPEASYLFSVCGWYYWWAFTLIITFLGMVPRSTTFSTFREVADMGGGDTTEISAAF